MRPYSASYREVGAGIIQRVALYSSGFYHLIGSTISPYGASSACYHMIGGIILPLAVIVSTISHRRWLNSAS